MPKPLKPGWQPTGWWRAVSRAGELWCESSDEAEVRRHARPTDTIQRHVRRVEERWEDAP